MIVDICLVEVLWLLRTWHCLGVNAMSWSSHLSHVNIAVAALAAFRCQHLLCSSVEKCSLLCPIGLSMLALLAEHKGTEKSGPDRSGGQTDRSSWVY